MVGFKFNFVVDRCYIDVYKLFLEVLCLIKVIGVILL